ncbi:MAG: DEAD/DEAH box helicase family protein, partial [Chloroflexota bacterium]|nr:DEAD/DEAH box helicase family protein [Chloroflexota bacterium]
MSTTGFQHALDHIRSISETEAQKGRLFERLMQAYFREDPLHQERFSQVWLWQEWVPHFNEEETRRAAQQPDSGPPLRFDLNDIGIDLVARERDGGWCAIQCKCYAPGTRIAKKHLDSFVSASARDPFTSRIFVDTGDSWGPNALKTLRGLKPACIVLRFGDLASRPFDWPDLVSRDPEDLRYVGEPFELRPHQREALEGVLVGFRGHDRGKLIMACGTGKTFTALRIAEAVAKTGGRVLYLVPSISLFAQSMREWATQKSVPHRYVGICSDTRAGRHDEDASMMELEIPVTTDPARISAALGEHRPGFMTVVFCTYHSLPIVERAQEEGAPPFDLVLCDEAHRTTGVDRPGDRTSPFVLVHDAERIRAKKRLYMTATPRIYTESSKAKAARHEADVFSMDEEATFGPEFHRLPFSRAIERDLLSDYQVVIFAVAESGVDGTLQAHLASDTGSEINITDAAKIVGCWRALQRRREGRDDGEADALGRRNGASATREAARPLSRAIAFANTIRASKRLEKHWDGVVAQAVAMLPEDRRPGALRCWTRHVDGQHNALERKGRIDWLKGRERGICRILSNARCLSEGVDVPALDAVFFMAPRKSPVEIVQAVGRVMRKSVGKKYGYIVLPVAIPPGMPPEKALADNKRFAAVWEVLRALRSHDDRFDAEINRIDLNEREPDRIIIDGDIDIDGDGQTEFEFPPIDLSPDAIYARIVEKCGDRKYWETWARDIADIYARLVERIAGLLASPGNEALVEWFKGFHDELRSSINETVTEAAAIDMIAQHILTLPVFEALFEGYDFASGNPIATALDELRRDFGEFGLENEIRDMRPFYESVRRRARGLDNSAARQQVLKELYEHLFRVAVRKQAERLGIVYTPTEVVDFILRSADHVLREEFGRGLTDSGVHVLDPFTGTGIFLARLLQLGLVDDADLERKYRRELHANEVVLLAYYIAAVNIEE